MTESTEQTDLSPVLLERAQQGDADAFCDLIVPVESRVLRQAFALCGDANVAEDLVQQTLIEAWKGLPQFNRTCRFTTWLYAILTHRWQKWHRAARCRPVSLARLSVTEAEAHWDRQQKLAALDPAPDEKAAWSESAARVVAAVESLPEIHREVILLRFFEEASLEEMASVLGCSLGTIKSRLYHALDKLRRMKVNLRVAEGEL